MLGPETVRILCFVSFFVSNPSPEAFTPTHLRQSPTALGALRIPQNVPDLPLHHVLLVKHKPRHNLDSALESTIHGRDTVQEFKDQFHTFQQTVQSFLVSTFNLKSNSEVDDIQLGLRNARRSLTLLLTIYETLAPDEQMEARHWLDSMQGNTFEGLLDLRELLQEEPPDFVHEDVPPKTHWRKTRKEKTTTLLDTPPSINEDVQPTFWRKKRKTTLVGKPTTLLDTSPSIHKSKFWRKKSNTAQTLVKTQRPLGFTQMVPIPFNVDKPSQPSLLQSLAFRQIQWFFHHQLLMWKPIKGQIHRAQLLVGRQYLNAVAQMSDERLDACARSMVQTMDIHDLEFPTILQSHSQIQGRVLEIAQRHFELLPPHVRVSMIRWFFSRLSRKESYEMLLAVPKGMAKTTLKQSGLWETLRLYRIVESNVFRFLSACVKAEIILQTERIVFRSLKRCARVVLWSWLRCVVLKFQSSFIKWTLWICRCVTYYSVHRFSFLSCIEMRVNETTLEWTDVFFEIGVWISSNMLMCIQRWKRNGSLSKVCLRGYTH